MKTTLKKWIMFLLVLAAAAAPVLAAEPTLKVGDPAPKLQTGRWLQGSPVKEFQPGKAYVVEFWATWDDHSRVAIPHLNEIHTKFKDKGLVVIGQASFEKDDGQVEPFLKSMGDQIAYRIALDDKTANTNGVMAVTWMAAAGCRSIPIAFLIDTKGVIAWIGHPLELKEEMIDQVLAGKYDTQKAAADYEKARKEETAQERQMAPAQAKMRAMAEAMREKKWDEALADLDAVKKLLPDNPRAAPLMIPLDVTHFILLLSKKDYPAAYKLAAELSDANKDKPKVQNYLAWRLISDKTIEKPNLELADMLVNRANAVAKGKDYEILDTQARVLFMKGQKEEAIKTQTEAVELAAPRYKQDLQVALDSYKKGQLPTVHTPN